MYEPVILQKRKPRSFAGTPISKLCMIGSLAVVFIPIIGLYFFSNFYWKKKKLIAELDECDEKIKKMTVYEEYSKTRTFWNRQELQGAVQLTIQNLMKKEKINAFVKSSSSDSDIPKANN
ncbi:hypothetical protein ANTPLA_LOCUS2233 [Anthophora plagiata]